MALPVRIATALLLVLATVACTREPDVAGGDTDAAASRARATVGARDGSLQAYYAALVAEHGEDIGLCPQADSPQAGACPDVDLPGAAPAPRRILLMLDASGSMAGRLDGRPKLAIAQDALLAFASRLEGDVQVALRVYGHRGGNREQDKPGSCRASDLVLPFAPRDPAAFEAAVRAFRPSGFTPIAGSLQAAARDFGQGGATAEGNVVYLVSDGIETCDGDPAAAARALRTSDIGVVVNVIGFDVDAAAERQLREVASAGGGEYLAARDRDALLRVFQQRLAALNARFNCRIGTASNAFNRTVDTHSARFNCLVDKASREFNAIVAAASDDANAGRATPGQRRYAIDQARARRARIVEPARAERDAAFARGRQARDRTVDDARRDRDDARRDAEAERPR
ncbi:vWA domain-containing protein [Luteimonas kalidii]|uniref:VWA domain-containing protein n=1 Tax=Luteimonas kalidii TaxID=3042025 RepID=A0ABT6JQ49_9GAMM|nr:VWA domain-containing protein [Luteimonas kalidii]MDH5832803.1 VWA domain-containing protein [Luteimonas kalidii]